MMRHWYCRICKNDQETIDTPRTHVCEDCLKGLAAMLCVESIGVYLKHEGVDQAHWMRKAELYAARLFLHWKAQ